MELTRVDADREGSYMNIVIFEDETVGHGSETENPSTRREKVTSIIVGMKSNQITVK